MTRKLWLLLAAWAALANPVEAKQWRLYENCSLIANPANDGDSFHVRYNKRRYLFRLYFVDCPESEDSLPERVAEQAAYWGLDPKTTVQLGKQAAKFTEKFLSKGFTVDSKLADAMGRSDKDRDYAIVRVGDQNLAVELVRNGLARIYGVGVDLPDGTSEKTMWWRLKTAEREAQKMKAGGWGLTAAAGTPPVPLPALAPAAAAPSTPLTEQSLVTPKTLAVYSLTDPNRQLGYLQKGASIRVLKEEPMNMVRIRFTASAGKMYEAQCRRIDLGL